MTLPPVAPVEACDGDGKTGESPALVAEVGAAGYLGELLTESTPEWVVGGVLTAPTLEGRTRRLKKRSWRCTAPCVLGWRR